MRISALQGVQGDQAIPFRDREDAGRKLARTLERFRDQNPIVLGLARGGVVLAAWVAKHLNAPLDVLICLKVGAPHHPEFAIGAVAPGGVRVADKEVLSRLDISDEEFDRMASERLFEVKRRLAAYRGDRPPPSFDGRTVIIVDDGLATGTTALAAVRYARTLGAGRVVLAAPVCSSSAIELLEREADDLACLSEPSVFYSVGQWYEDFSQVRDEEVLDLLESVNDGFGAEKVEIDVGGGKIRGDLTFGEPGSGFVIFAHGSGSSRLSPRNQFVASALNKAGHGTLLIDLLTEDEELVDTQTRHLRFDIPFLTERLASATHWLFSHHDAPVGYFGASTGAAAAIGAAARFKDAVRAIVSRGGRPDLASTLLPLITVPTLLIVGERDSEVIRLNRQALSQLDSEAKQMRIVLGASHLFEEPGTLEEVARLASGWFDEYLR